ncbi:MAG: DUF3997 domain-containing protein [Kiritimatiellaeota bacterium]|nr:DUF3997 domain-containing protein [Kiritimatiellota bacterium]
MKKGCGCPFNFFGFVILGFGLYFTIKYAIRGCIASGDWMIGPGVQDFTAELCGNYSIWRTSAHYIKISPASGRYNESTPIVPEKVVEVGHDDIFIVAKRNDLRRRGLNPNDNYMEPAPGVFDYWILDTSVPEVHGPMTLDEYAQKRQELGISENVGLKDIYEYRKK